MSIKWKPLLLALLIPLAVGGLAGFLTRESMMVFEMVEKPPLSPPGWLFPVVWTALYLMMGLASYLVAVSGQPAGDALNIYGIQLAVNFLWPILFFNFRLFGLSLVWLVLLWVLVLVTLLRFWRISPAAGWLMVPYLLWVTFAAYLNAGIWILN